MTDTLGSHAPQLLDLATQVRLRAHAPYSSFMVGAALATTDGNTFSGCNVENRSYGLTTCAERNAIAAAVAGGMKAGEMRELAVIGNSEGPISPCGACRQVIAEFAHRDCIITGHDLAGNTRSWTVAELLPDMFDAKLRD